MFGIALTFRLTLIGCPIFKALAIQGLVSLMFLPDSRVVTFCRIHRPSPSLSQTFVRSEIENAIQKIPWAHDGNAPKGVQRGHEGDEDGKGEGLVALGLGLRQAPGAR